MNKAPHHLTRSHKQLSSRAPGTCIDLTCATCGELRGNDPSQPVIVAQLVYVGRNRVDLLHWPTGAAGRVTVLDLDPAAAVEFAQVEHRADYDATAATPVDNGPTWVAGNPPVGPDGRVTGHYESTPVDATEQPALPWSAMADEAAAALMAQALGLLLPQVKSAAAGQSNADADLLAIRVLDDLGLQLRALSATRARNAIYAGVPAAKVARALGITRQAASKRFGK